MFRFIVGIPIFMHGVAHVSGFLASWTANRNGFSEGSWIFSGNTPIDGSLGKTLSPLWLVAVLGLAATGVGAMLRQSWWPKIGVPSALVSLALMVIWWKAVPPGGKVGAVFDVIILVALLLPWRERVMDLVK